MDAPTNLVASIYCISPEGTVSSIRLHDTQIVSTDERLLDLKFQIMRIANSVSVDYVWNKDWFFVYKETEETPNYAYLKVEMDVGDSVEDEWMVARILLEVSNQIDDVAVIMWV